MWSDVEGVLRDGLHRLALTVAGFVPGVLSMLLVLGFSVALAHLVRFALRRLLTGIDFDRRVNRWGFADTGEWTPERSPTSVVVHTGFWFVLLVGFLAGLQSLGTGLTDALASGLFAFIPDLLSAGLLFAVGVGVARFMGRTVLIGAVNMQIHSARFLSVTVKWLVVLFATALALQRLKVGGTVLTVSFAVVFGGIVLALALAVGLGSREAVHRTWERSWEEEERRKAASGDVDEIHHM
jgi:hypothetical protein